MQVKPDISAKAVSRDVTHAGLLINPGERDIEANCQFFGSKKVISILMAVHGFLNGFHDDPFKLISEEITK